MRRTYLAAAAMASLLLLGAGCASQGTVQTQTPNTEAVDGVIEGTYSGNAAVNAN